MAMYLMIFEDNDYGMIAEGDDAVSAVQSHYNEMNGYCSADLETEERFSVTVYALRDDDAARVVAEVEDLSAGYYLNYAAQLEALGRSTSSEIVTVVMAKDGSAQVSRPEVHLDLFERLHQG